MPSAPQTMAILRGVQAFVQTNLATLTIDSLPALSAFSSADAALYGTTNAIYLGPPRDPTTAYIRQCWIAPTAEDVQRHAYGGKVWDDIHIYLKILYASKGAATPTAPPWFQTFQDLVAFRDAAYPLFMRHAMLAGVPIVRASKIMTTSKAPLGYQDMSELGIDWQTWGFDWWFSSEYSVGPIVA